MFQSKRRIIIQHNKQVRQRREQYMDKLKRVNYKQDIISEIVNNELVTNKKLNYQYQKSILKFKILKEMYDTLESERQDLSLKLYPQLKYEPKQLTCKRFDWYKVSGLPEDALKSFEALMEQRPVSSDVLSDTFPNNIFSDISEGAPEEMNIQTNSSIMSSTSTINREKKKRVRGGGEEEVRERGGEEEEESEREEKKKTSRRRRREEEEVRRRRRRRRVRRGGERRRRRRRREKKEEKEEEEEEGERKEEEKKKKKREKKKEKKKKKKRVRRRRGEKKERRRIFLK
ncbi:hypothetical protein WDU94_007150 [Cyamophila willieti]